MTYQIIQPPILKTFREMSKKEIREYNRWFMEQIPVRIAILRSVVHETPGFEDWESDFSEASLASLGEWFASQVETRTRTARNS